MVKTRKQPSSLVNQGFVIQTFPNFATLVINVVPLRVMKLQNIGTDEFRVIFPNVLISAMVLREKYYADVGSLYFKSEHQIVIEWVSFRDSVVLALRADSSCPKIVLMVVPLLAPAKLKEKPQ